MLIYGKNVVKEALLSTFNIQKISIEDNKEFDPRIREIEFLANKREIPIVKLSRGEIAKIAKLDKFQSVTCEIDFQEAKLKDILSREKRNSFIFIFSSSDEHNVGAIIRTAECMGLSGVILPNDIKVTPTVVKTSAGSIFHIPVIHENVFQTIKDLKREGFNIIGIERDGTSITDAKISFNNLFIIGGEDKSLTQQTQNLCNQILEIPQFGKVNSLNMSVACGMVLFEYARQNIAELNS